MISEFGGNVEELATDVPSVVLVVVVGAVKVSELVVDGTCKPVVVDDGGTVHSQSPLLPLVYKSLLGSAVRSASRQAAGEAVISITIAPLGRAQKSALPSSAANNGP